MKEIRRKTGGTFLMNDRLYAPERLRLRVVGRTVFRSKHLTIDE